MSFLDKLTANIPFLQKPAEKEYFFALNIGLEKIKACVWVVEDNQLKIINPQVAEYHSTEEIIEVTDKLLDLCLGDLAEEPSKILFGVPDSFLVDEELKEPYLKLLQRVSKDLDIQPMAYVASSHAVSNLLDKTEGGPTTAILVDIEKEHLAISVTRAGKIDGTKVLGRGDNLGADVEKGLLAFADVEVLPSRILIFSASFDDLSKQRETLLSFPWMSQLPFLHLPKIDILPQDSDISSVALAGAVEKNPEVKYSPEKATAAKSIVTSIRSKETQLAEPMDTGFVRGDIEERDELDNTPEEKPGLKSELDTSEVKGDDEEDLEQTATGVAEIPMRSPQVPEEMESDLEVSSPQKPGWLRLPNFTGGKFKFLMPIILVMVLVASYLLLPAAEVTIFVEPKVLEKDAQVTADPSIKQVDEANKKIPGQTVEIQVSGSDKLAAAGTKMIGDPARGKVIIYNGTDASRTFSAGTILTSADGLKFTLTSSVSVASRSASLTDPLSTVSGKSDPVDVTASVVGADSNIPSGTSLSIGGFSQSQVVAKAEGNFSGGTSKEVTVVTDADQKKLLAQLASSLRKQAQEQLQAKMPDKKILEEALSEEIVKKSYNKAVNDQAGEFSLNLTVKYKGIAYSDSDLKMIVAKLVDTNIPEGYQLDLSDTETQADVSKQEKGQLIFLARFKAKLTPKLDLSSIKQQIRGKTPKEVSNILQGYENVLESEVKISPSLPSLLERLPLLTKRIKVEVKLK